VPIHTKKLWRAIESTPPLSGISSEGNVGVAVGSRVAVRVGVCKTAVFVAVALGSIVGVSTGASVPPPPPRTDVAVGVGKGVSVGVALEVAVGVKVAGMAVGGNCVTWACTWLELLRAKAKKPANATSPRQIKLIRATARIRNNLFDCPPFENALMRKLPGINLQIYTPFWYIITAFFIMVKYT